MRTLGAGDVPDEQRAFALDGLAHELRLPLGVPGGVGGLGPVLRPRGASRLPFEPPDQPLEPLDVRDDQLALEARLAELALQVVVPLLVAALQARVPEDVR